jgi:hypothetical protein
MFSVQGSWGKTSANDEKAKARENKLLSRAFVRINPGDFLLSHAVSRAVPSAPAGLTSVFGMGTGVTLPTKSPENFLETSAGRSPKSNSN